MMFRPAFRRYGFGFPWQEIEQFRQEMDRLLSRSLADFGAAYPHGYPAINVWTNQEGAVVTAELPGFDPANIDIAVAGETLTLNGSRQPDEVAENVKYHRQERGAGNFTRTIQLPFPVESDGVEALFEKGILHISLPRAEADKTKKISVKTA